MVFEESFKVQDVLTHQRASSPKGTSGRGDTGDVLVVVIWCGGVCPCVCVTVTALPIERRSSDPGTESCVNEVGEKPSCSC